MAEGALRFRRDLPASNVEADGVLYVEVSDPRSGKSFRFYDFEYAVALKLDGRPLDQVAADLRENAELELTVDQLAGFADQLSSLGFVEQAPSFFPPLAEDESGEWPSPAIRAPEEAAGRAPTPAPPAGEERAEEPTPAPPPTMATLGRTQSPAASARSLREHTVTSFPPEDRPAGAGEGGEDQRQAAPTAPLSGMKTPTPELDSATTDLGMPMLVRTPAPLPAGPPKPSLTPEPIRTGIPGAASPFAREGGGNGAAEATVTDTRRPSEDDLEAIDEIDPDDVDAALREAASGLPAGGPAAVDRSGEKTPPADLMAQADAAASGAGGPPTAGAGAGFGRTAPATPADRRELPTKRLRAVSDLSAEEPGEILHDADHPMAPLPGPPAPGAAMPGVLGGTRAASLAAGAPGAETRLPAETPSLRPGDVGRLPAWIAYAALGTLAAIIVAVVIYRFKVASETPPVTVRAVVPSPTTVYRFWDESGTVERAEGTGFAFASEGKVAELAAAGTRFGGGDVIGLLEAGKRFRAELSRHRERLAYYEQMRETMTRENNRPEIRQAEIKIAEKKRLIDEAEANLAKQAIVALQSGEVAEALAQPGDQVKEGQPVLRLKGTTYRASFTMSRENAGRARQLGFCRVEIEGKPLDCSLSAEGGDETRLVIDLPNDPVVAAGKSVRLARDRLDGVFPLPASSLQRVGDSDRLFVVVSGGDGMPDRAELRVIGVADRTASEVVVDQGIDVGDRVVLNPPPGLKADDRVLISETTSR